MVRIKGTRFQSWCERKVVSTFFCNSVTFIFCKGRLRPPFSSLDFSTQIAPSYFFDSLKERPAEKAARCVRQQTRRIALVLLSSDLISAIVVIFSTLSFMITLTTSVPSLYSPPFSLFKTHPDTVRYPRTQKNKNESAEEIVDHLHRDHSSFYRSLAFLSDAVRRLHVHRVPCTVATPPAAAPTRRDACPPALSCCFPI